MWVWASHCWVRAFSRSRWSCSATVRKSRAMHTACVLLLCTRYTLHAALHARCMCALRAALAHPLERIPFCGMTLRRSVIWACGLGLYCIANALKVVALMYGPMTVRVHMPFTVLADATHVHVTCTCTLTCTCEPHAHVTM